MFILNDSAGSETNKGANEHRIIWAPVRSQKATEEGDDSAKFAPIVCPRRGLSEE